MNIYIVRHGRTVYNEEEKMQGSSNSPLLESSLEAAHNLGKAFAQEGISFDRVYSSDLIRTIDTADYIMKGMDLRLPINQVYNIREMDFGHAEAKPIVDVWTEVAKAFGYKDSEDLLSSKEANERLNLLHQVEAYDNAESIDVFHKRIYKGLNELVTDARSEQSKNVLVVAHGLTILGLLSLLGHDDQVSRSFENLSVSLINHDEDFEINFVNRMYI